MPRVVLALAAFLAILAAGCVAPGAGTEAPAAEAGAAAHPPPPVPDFDFSTLVQPDHPWHSVGPMHAGAHGLSLVGHAGLSAILPPTVQGSVTQIDVAGDHAVLAGMSGGLGFALVNVSDPAKPVPVSWWPATAYGHSARFSDDGAYVFFGCQPGFDPAAFVFRTCHGGSDLAPGLPGSEIVVVDVRDKSAPKLVTSVPSLGTHNLYAAAIGGVDHVFSETGEIFRFDRASGTLDLVAQVPARHDQTVARHPLTGDWLLINGHNDLSIYNVNDPADPQVVYEGKTDASWTGWHDQVLVPGLVDGRVVVAVAGENIAGTALRQLEVTFLDVTDPAAPGVLSTWKPPFVAKLPWANYRFSLHEMAATPHGQVAVAIYHGGVWVVDVSTKERQEAPVTLAAYQPDKTPDVTPSYALSAVMPLETPYVWGAAWDAPGHLLVPDAHTGLYVLEPAWGLRPGVDSGQ